MDRSLRTSWNWAIFRLVASNFSWVSVKAGRSAGLVHPLCVAGGGVDDDGV
eukprot:CAMPEP_0172398630 /NCGR_PEP_ID=MMETSP1061-20121228/37245_1 /TAXON_ID=37318 /ORGANISM="Pseudo-nitzschia pungens, Strain cf. pungens" /LENGTH=50 /DNA_ID=CAMNT_0013131235 /DNA_START=28 /DNA_END=176 /DNA_ORIENTATION=+